MQVGENFRAKVISEAPEPLFGAEIQVPNGPNLSCTTVRLAAESGRWFMALGTRQRYSLYAKC